ncbi:hypothetical protein [Candidatus Ferrigenium straubiae]|jgi:SHS2 domain-containing protein|uniref:hypothetical protein n=1 Tax=Candidatus Ferrigenium straubiae TaxID=2919506 RepID=UPI003F4AE914
MTATARWEHFPHQADIGVCGFGTTPVEAFERAAVIAAALHWSAKQVDREMLAGKTV